MPAPAAASRQPPEPKRTAWPNLGHTAANELAHHIGESPTHRYCGSTQTETILSVTAH